MTHEMIRTDDENQVWECPSCPHSITFIEGQYRTLVPGDDVAHCGTTLPDLYLGSIDRS